MARMRKKITFHRVVLGGKVEGFTIWKVSITIIAIKGIQSIILNFKVFKKKLGHIEI